MKKAVLAFVIVLIFLFTSNSAVYARFRHKSVLGTSTASAEIPATVEGPGLILPDSPLFFLDQIKQNVRLALAFTSEDKAKVYDSIAGERMAELRIMLSKDNKDAVRLDLQQISDNLQKASEEVNQAKLRGKDVSMLAKNINDNIKLRQKSLDILEGQTNGDINTTVKATQDSVMDAKVSLEDHLPQADLENEIQDDLDREMSSRFEDASDSAREMQDLIDELEAQASNSAQKSLTRREEAIKQAIAQKNEALKKSEEAKLELAKKNQEQLLKVQVSAAAQAKKAVEDAQNAATTFQEAKKKSEETRITNTTISPTVAAASTGSPKPTTVSEKE